MTKGRRTSRNLRDPRDLRGLRDPRDPRGQVIACALAALLVCLSWMWQNDPAIDSLFDSDGAGANNLEVVARVTSQPRPYGYQPGSTAQQWWASVTIHTWFSPQITTRATTLVTAFVSGTPPPWLSWLRMRGALTRGGVGGSELIFRVTSATVISGSPSWSRWSDPVRDATHRAVEGLSESAQVLVPGVAIGDTSRMSTEMDAQMKVSGLTHLTAVSGSHFVILTAALWFLLGACQIRAKPRAVAVSIGLAAMVILVRPEPSVIRAAAMAAVSVIGILAGRRSSPVPALAAGVAILVIIDPFLAVNIGFALSVAATTGLVLVAPRIETQLPRRLPTAVRSQVAIAIAAHALCAPVIVVISPYMLGWSVIANLLVAPVGAVMTILSALVAVLAIPAAPLAHMVAWLAQAPAWWIVKVAQWCANAPGAQLAWPEGPVGVLLMISTMGACVVMLVAVRGFTGYVLTTTKPLWRIRYGTLRAWLHQRSG